MEATDSPGTRAGHVLYLDDDEPLVLLTTHVLMRMGYLATGLTDAESAVAAVRADPLQFDLVVTDYRMPAMSGLDVAREVHRIRPDLPVVLVSGYVTETLRDQARSAGVLQLLSKPSTVEELAKAIGDSVPSRPGRV